MHKHKCCCNDDFAYNYDWQKTNIYSIYYNSNNTEYILSIEQGQTKDIDITINLESDRVDSLYFAIENEKTYFNLISDDPTNKTSDWKATISASNEVGSQTYDVILKLKSGVKVLLYQGLLKTTGIVEKPNTYYSHILINHDAFDGYLNIITTKRENISLVEDLVNLIKNDLILNMYYNLNNKNYVINSADRNDDSQILKLGDFLTISQSHSQETIEANYLNLGYQTSLIDQVIIL